MTQLVTAAERGLKVYGKSKVVESAWTSGVNLLKTKGVPFLEEKFDLKPTIAHVQFEEGDRFWEVLQDYVTLNDLFFEEDFNGEKLRLRTFKVDGSFHHHLRDEIEEGYLFKFTWRGTVFTVSEKPAKGSSSTKMGNFYESVSGGDELVSGESSFEDKMKEMWTSQKKSLHISVDKKFKDSLPAFIKEVLEWENKRGKRRPTIYLSRGDWWQNGTKVQPRSLDSLALSRANEFLIVEDLERFNNSQELYIKRGVPWRRAYLFSGPPGTGKSSLAGALAYEYQKDLNVLSLKDLISESALFKLVAACGENSIILIEDIDTFETSSDRESGSSEGDRITLGALLNALDGVASPEGMITIMSSNYPERIDAALKRPGRVDVHVELSYLDEYQIHKLHNVWFGSDAPQDIVSKFIEVSTPADLIQYFHNELT